LFEQVPAPAHTPFVHTPVGHTTPQPPQLFGSLNWFTHTLPQLRKPVGHWAFWQAPSLQIVPTSQTCAQ
jgi:hypothetical protein